MNRVRLHHVTINTTRLDETVRFYDELLRLRPGWRPDFGFGGAWLYPPDSTEAIVHLIEVVAGEEHRVDAGTAMFDHVAFLTEGLADYLAILQRRGDWFDAMPVTGTPYVQVHHLDPNGVKIEAAFEEPLPADAPTTTVEAPMPFPKRKTDGCTES